jgi:hydrogenase nickel incorporation protein HypB
MELVVAKDILKANDQIAEDNRRRLESAGVFTANILGSPGSGKTALIEALAPYLKSRVSFGVIEGDLATSRDAERIEAIGVPVVQINTGGACHLDAGMVGSALDKIALEKTRFLFIENVGNLVCPAGYRLGEHLRLVVLSVTEGDDKIAKYPTMFSRIDTIVVNKIDLLQHVDFDLDIVKKDARVVAPEIDIFPLSAKTGENVKELADFICRKAEEKS